MCASLSFPFPCISSPPSFPTHRALFSSIVLQARAVLQIYKEKFAALDSQLLSLNAFVSREPSRAADFLGQFWVLTEEGDFTFVVVLVVVIPFSLSDLLSRTELRLWKLHHKTPAKSPDPWLTPARWVYHQRKIKGVDFLTAKDFPHVCSSP